LEELGGLEEVEGRAIIPDPDFEDLERIEGRFFGAVGAFDSVSFYLSRAGAGMKITMIADSPGYSVT
jgi:hypothetical protein